MEEAGRKITLPKELQKQMLEFFLKTSIPRIKKKNLLFYLNRNRIGAIMNEG